MKLRAQLLNLWQEAAHSSDEPDNEHLIAWVRLLIKDSHGDQQALKNAERRIESLQRTLRLPHPTTTVVGAVVEHLNAAIAVLTGQVEPAQPAAPVGTMPRTWDLLVEVDDDLPAKVDVERHGRWVKLQRSREYVGYLAGQERTMRLEQLRYLGKVTEVSP